jgi:hypothetical protein
MGMPAGIATGTDQILLSSNNMYMVIGTTNALSPAGPGERWGASMRAASATSSPTRW